MRYRHICAAGLLALGAVTLSASGSDPLPALVGPYYPTASWAQTLPCRTLANCPRFVVLPNFGHAAVLDRETGLVWERSPSTELVNWHFAHVRCNEFVTLGGRLGWRLPTVNELASLVDPGRSDPALPAGHPFTNVQLTSHYWSATTDSRLLDNKWAVGFFGDGDVRNAADKDGHMPVWCVRGGQGTDPQ
jgi:hypothetical protein